MLYYKSKEGSELKVFSSEITEEQLKLRINLDDYIELSEKEAEEVLTNNTIPETDEELNTTNNEIIEEVEAEKAKSMKVIDSGKFTSRDLILATGGIPDDIKEKKYVEMEERKKNKEKDKNKK